MNKVLTATFPKNFAGNVDTVSDL